MVKTQNWVPVLPVVGLLMVCLFVPAKPDTCGTIAFSTDRDSLNRNSWMDRNWEIYIMDTNGNNQTNITRNPKDDYDPSWSPDGTKIAFVSDRDKNSEIYIMNPDGSSQVNVTNNEHADCKPAWSPDGKRIAFASQRVYWKGNWEIYIMNPDGSSPVNVTNNRAYDTEPAWSPDGSQIAFTSTREGRWEIYIMNSDGRNVRKLLNSPVYDTEPAWSPDGKKIAFCSLRDGEPDIYVIHTDGTNLKRLTNDPFWDSDPEWSPDGKKIIFYSDRDGEPDIYVMNADGTAIERITHDSFDNWSPQWCCRTQAFIDNMYTVSLGSTFTLLFFSVKPSRLKFFSLVILSGSLLFLPQLELEEHPCSHSEHNIKKAEDLTETVAALLEEARSQGLATPDVEALVSDAAALLKKARTYFRSRACDSANTQALKTLILLRTAQTRLESILNERKEEYAVYSAVITKNHVNDRGFYYGIGEYIPKPVQFMVILEYTGLGRDDPEDLDSTFQYVHEHIPAVEQETFNDFKWKNALEYPLDNFFTITVEVVLICGRESREIFWKGNDYFEFYAKYPYSQGIMQLSRVGFNAEMTQALVYVGNRSGYDCGVGYYVLLTRKNGAWVIHGEIVIWVS